MATASWLVAIHDDSNDKTAYTCHQCRTKLSHGTLIILVPANCAFCVQTSCQNASCTPACCHQVCQCVHRQHAARYEAEFLEDMDSLGCRRPDVMTRVSEYMTEIVEYIQTIMNNKMAYESNGSVNFDTQAFRCKLGSSVQAHSSSHESVCHNIQQQSLLTVTAAVQELYTALVSHCQALPNIAVCMSAQRNDKHR